MPNKTKAAKKSAPKKKAKPKAKPKAKQAGWFVYLLECQNGRLYTGITNDIEKRFAKHASGKGAMFTRLNRPSRILASKPCKNRSEASKLEYAVKQLPRSKKAAALS